MMEKMESRFAEVTDTSFVEARVGVKILSLAKVWMEEVEGVIQKSATGFGSNRK